MQESGTPRKIKSITVKWIEEFRGGAENLKDCACDYVWNLPMQMSNEDQTEFWIECDLCGNSTKRYGCEEAAEFKWNEFQFKNGKREKYENTMD